MKAYVNKYDLQDFYGRYGYEYHEGEQKGDEPYITDASGAEIATAPHHKKDYFEGDDKKAMNKLADQLKSQGVLTELDESDGDDDFDYEKDSYDNYDGEDIDSDEDTDYDYDEKPDNDDDDYKSESDDEDYDAEDYDAEDYKPRR